MTFTTPSGLHLLILSLSLPGEVGGKRGATGGELQEMRRRRRKKEEGKVRSRRQRARIKKGEEER